MSLTWDPSGDYEVFDGLESVTFRKKGSRTVGDTGTVTYTNTDTVISALKRMVSHRHFEKLGGILQAGDTMWEIPDDVTPAVGDHILEGSDVWRVVWVDEKPVLSMWRVFARH